MNPELRRILQIVLDRQVGCPYTPNVCTDPNPDNRCSYCLLKQARDFYPPISITDATGTREL